MVTRTSGANDTVVTGAAGFLGSHLVDALLEEGQSVLGIDNLVTGDARNLANARQSRSFHFRHTDVTTDAPFPRADRYFHLASPASPIAYQRDPVATLRSNAEGTYRVLEAARLSDGRALVASTSEVYGDPEIHPQVEDYWGNVNPIGVRSCYDEGKRFSEALSVAYTRHYGLDIRIARIFNTYGPRMAIDDGRVISNFLVQALRGEPLTIRGTGRQTRSFCYVSDTVEGLEKLMSARRVPGPVNIGNPSEITIVELVDNISRVLRKKLKVTHLSSLDDDPRRRCPDISRARRYLDWSPRVNLADGLQQTIAYFRKAIGHSTTAR
jgi:UDP-glucuronate decarboxylase